MYKKLAQLTLVMLVILIFAVGGGVQAGEIVYVDDIRQNIIDKKSTCQNGRQCHRVG